MLMCLKTLWRFFPCRKAFGDVSFFLTLLVFEVSFSFLDYGIVAEEGIGSEKNKTIKLEKLNKKSYLGISITVNSPDNEHSH